MDYPFYLMKLAQLPVDVLASIKGMLDERNIAKHPHFTSVERNPNTFRLHDPKGADVVDSVTNYLDTAGLMDKASLYWNEINLIAPKGILGEHSDLSYAGYNVQKGNPQEVMLTHKIHVHLSGHSELSFRRSKFEPVNTFVPEEGGCYWYNNYVLHSSHNPSEATNRVALSLIYHDAQWRRRARLFDEHGFLFQKAYQL